jgi:hypothetical protein
MAELAAVLWLLIMGAKEQPPVVAGSGQIGEALG